MLDNISYCVESLQHTHTPIQILLFSLASFSHPAKCGEPDSNGGDKAQLKGVLYHTADKQNPAFTDVDPLPLTTEPQCEEGGDTSGDVIDESPAWDEMRILKLSLSLCSKRVHLQCVCVAYCISLIQHNSYYASLCNWEATVRGRMHNSYKQNFYVYNSTTVCCM